MHPYPIHYLPLRVTTLALSRTLTRLLAIAACLVAFAAADGALAQTATRQSASSGEASRWRLEADVLLAAPTSEVFRDGWGAGYGLSGSLRRTLGSWLQLGVEGEFVQFGFTGLEGFGTLGGARRIYGAAVPLHILLWERRSPGREQFTLVASAGWSWQQIDGTFEGASETDVSFPSDGDGLRLAGEVRFSRTLYRQTRWNIGVRFTHSELENETPQYLSLVLGAHMPLSGSRPNSR